MTPKFSNSAGEGRAEDDAELIVVDWRRNGERATSRERGFSRPTLYQTHNSIQSLSIAIIINYTVSYIYIRKYHRQLTRLFQSPRTRKRCQCEKKKKGPCLSLNLKMKNKKYIYSRVVHQLHGHSTAEAKLNSSTRPAQFSRTSPILSPPILHPSTCRISYQLPRICGGV